MAGMVCKRNRFRLYLKLQIKPPCDEASFLRYIYVRDWNENPSAALFGWRRLQWKARLFLFRKRNAPKLLIYQEHVKIKPQL